MFQGSNEAGSAETNSSASRDELMSFSASREQELETMLNCVPPDMRQSMDHWIRVFVKEQIVLAHKKPLTSMDRNIEDEICSSDSRSLELRFSNNICSPVLTGKIIKGEGGESLKVALVDSLTGEEVNSGPESSNQVQIFVLEGDSDNAGGENWTHEEFDKRIVGVQKGKKSLLVGNVCLNLIKGTGVVPEISFTSNSSWMKNSRFRLGARIVDNSNRTRFKEAITKPFDLKDCRGNWNNCCFNNSRVAFYLEYEPHPSSLKNLKHLFQMIRKGTFAKYDYGRWKNLLNYGQINPPNFDLSQIPDSLPIWMAYGGNDALADVIDVQNTLKELQSKPNLVYLENYGHVDFLLSIKAYEDLYDGMIRFFRSCGKFSSY